MQSAENQRQSLVLIVDDLKIGRDTLESLLLSENYVLEFAAHGMEALEKAARYLPDLILLDVMMPGIDGYEVCRRLRADAAISQIPIILVTALDDRESRLQGLEAGADDFISKPFDRTELRARVRNITRLNRYRLLLEERTRFEGVVAQSDDGYCVIDDRDRLIYANEQARLFLGLDAAEPRLPDRPFLELVRENFSCEPAEAWDRWPALEDETVPLRYLVRPESFHATGVGSR